MRTQVSQTVTVLTGEDKKPELSIQCPVCLMVSFNPNDIREGYCGNCNKWTSEGKTSDHRPSF